LVGYSLASCIVLARWQNAGHQIAAAIVPAQSSPVTCQAFLSRGIVYTDVPGYYKTPHKYWKAPVALHCVYQVAWL